jgi:L-fuculose-phosphate aldolase
MVTPEEIGNDPRHPELWDAPEHIRMELALTMSHIYRLGMTTASGGNMSVIDANGNVWITPSGTDKGELKPDDIVCVAPDGSFTGLHDPSMEYALHRDVYNARPDLRAIIHAHPPVLTSFSIVHRIPDTAMSASWHSVCGTAGYAGYAIPGTDSMGKIVASEFSKGHDAVIMENHAVVTGGADLGEALARLETLECCAVTTHAAGFTGEIVLPTVPREADADVRAAKRIVPPAVNTGPAGKTAVTGPVEETLAGDICRMTARACNRGLMYGYSGTVSARVSDSRFIITPEGVTRWNMKKESLLVSGAVELADGPGAGPGSSPALTGSGDQLTAGMPPDITGAGLTAWTHAAIYRRFPGIRAVITAQPPYLMAFAVTGKEIDVRTIPESWLLLREVPSVPYDLHSPVFEDVIGKLASGCPAVIINNDSVLVTGESLFQAFDRLEVAEATAKSLVLARQLGSVHQLTTEMVEDLGRKFTGKQSH